MKVKLFITALVMIFLSPSTSSQCAPQSNTQLNPHLMAVVSQTRKALESVERISYTYNFLLRVRLHPGFFDGSQIIKPDGDRLSDDDLDLAEMITTGTIFVKYDPDVLFLKRTNMSCEGLTKSKNSKDLWYRTDKEKMLWVFDRSVFVEKIVNHSIPNETESVKVIPGSTTIPDIIMSSAVTPGLLELAGLQRIDENPDDSRPSEFPPYNMIFDDPTTMIVVLEDEVPVGAILQNAPSTSMWRSFSTMSVDRATSHILSKATILYDTTTSKTIPLQRTEYSYDPPSSGVVPSRISVITPSHDSDLNPSGEPQMQLFMTLIDSPELEFNPNKSPREHRFRKDQMLTPQPKMQQ